MEGDSLGEVRSGRRVPTAVNAEACIYRLSLGMSAASPASRCRGASLQPQSRGLSAVKIHTLPRVQEFKGYVFRITGGQDKQGFAMKQGVLVPHRVRLLMTPGDQGFRGFGRRNGERRRKSVRGCIVSQDLSVLNLIVVKKGEADIPGLTDRELPSMRGPKRASNIRKLFNLTKEDNVMLPSYVNQYRRFFEDKNGKKHSKAPKIQVSCPSPDLPCRLRAVSHLLGAGRDPSPPPSPSPSDRR